jgi:hypothetical protein
MFVAENVVSLSKRSGSIKAREDAMCGLHILWELRGLEKLVLEAFPEKSVDKLIYIYIVDFTSGTVKAKNISQRNIMIQQSTKCLLRVEA